MRAARTFVGSSLLLATMLAAPSASAGTTTPVSALASLPRAVPLKTPEATTSIVGLALKTKDGYRDTKWHDLLASTGRGYCLSSGEGGARWMSTYGSSSRSSAEDLDLDHLVEKDGKVTLERTRVHFDPADATLTATGRSQVELHEITRTAAGIVVWAFRDGRDIVVLARNVERGMESPRPQQDGTFPFISSDGCPYAGARLDARKPEAGTIAQLTGALPAQGTGKDKVIPRFMIDASLSRVSRDPEPMLAIRVRVRD
jgi:hypothetical protein